MLRLVMSRPIPEKLIKNLGKATLTGRLGRQYHTRMTMRRHWVLAGVAAGLSNPAIAQQLGLSSETVKRQVSLLLDMYGARNRTHLVALAYRKGDL